jgi:hypothetical protein
MPGSLGAGTPVRLAGRVPLTPSLVSLGADRVEGPPLFLKPVVRRVKTGFSVLHGGLSPGQLLFGCGQPAARVGWLLHRLTPGAPSSLNHGPALLRVEATAGIAVLQVGLLRRRHWVVSDFGSRMGAARLSRFPSRPSLRGELSLPAGRTECEMKRPFAKLNG